MKETVGVGVYMREERASRVMGTDRPYGEFYDFYSVSPEYFGLTSYVPPALTFRNSVFCPQCIYLFCVDLRTNSDYFSIQH
jgi:hypothetical protein